MTIGGALILIAAGAILKWAVTGSLSWVSVHTVGTVLFIVGIVGFVIAVAYTYGWLNRRSRVDYEARPDPGYETTHTTRYQS